MAMTPTEEFLALFLRHQAGLRAFLAGVCRDRAAADDLLQDSALVLWQNFASYDRSRPFGAWARGVAFKKVLQEREKSRRIPLAFPPEAVQAVIDAYDRTESESPSPDGLRDCLQRLAPAARDLLAMRYEQSLKLQAIAARTGKTLDAVHKSLSRIREVLHDCLGRRPAAE
jgi:RNA polymerase sigma-70 factor, ECF subfamily